MWNSLIIYNSLFKMELLIHLKKSIWSRILSIVIFVVIVIIVIIIVIAIILNVIVILEISFEVKFYSEPQLHYKTNFPLPFTEQ